MSALGAVTKVMWSRLNLAGTLRVQGVTSAGVSRPSVATSPRGLELPRLQENYSLRGTLVPRNLDNLGPRFPSIMQAGGYEDI